MKAETITNLIGKLEQYMEYIQDLPVESTNVGMLVDVVNARSALIKEREDAKDEA